MGGPCLRAACCSRLGLLSTKGIRSGTKDVARQFYLKSVAFACMRADLRLLAALVLERSESMSSAPPRHRTLYRIPKLGGLCWSMISPEIRGRRALPAVAKLGCHTILFLLSPVLPLFTDGILKHAARLTKRRSHFMSQRRLHMVWTDLIDPSSDVYPRRLSRSRDACSMQIRLHVMDILQPEGDGGTGSLGMFPHLSRAAACARGLE